ncbi:cysteine protease StiP domain-containing protein [Novosphingobium album (ex Liu et al. 2023)]|uniref:Tellurite-like stress resistance cysteine protease StiP n=1 Tax=Novosphingobium album (ex Liu et al. 2023) TaxID=3031130 RepID=A0ABT5WQM8_9SPHN|nr:cysteine protease StiP domain-containing protein [Novosphingobium album (ex Liu et al. 2023)]MDE8652323.1 tellurite-like stress resistance cysteine protease StiP [Novosphingobium album (ex Liu et al. 2023)]
MALEVMTGFSGSYAPEDVTFLLKPIAMAATDVAAKEAAIQSGRRHYSEMIAPETIPDQDYLALYHAALARNGARLAQDVASLAARIAGQRPGGEIVLVSLARAGTPIGVLLARTLRAWGHRASHYSISIIRDRGLDRVALAHIAARHDPRDAVFVDGWTGKGAIAGELRASLAARSHGFAAELAVIADPAGQADFAATDDDYLIASGLLNGIVSGLVSRSVLNDEVVGSGDFHACVTYPHYAHADLSRAFVDAIAPLAAAAAPRPVADHTGRRAALMAGCEDMVQALLARAGTRDRNRIKPGIAEATRALLRRMPERLLVRDPQDADVAHLLHLAVAHRIPVEPLGESSHYRAVAIIRGLGNEA